MKPPSVPRELIDLENRLRDRVTAKPSVDFQNRVMEAVQIELAKPAQSSDVGYWDYRYWFAAAAAFLIVMNLSMISATNDEFSLRPRQSSNELRADLQALRHFEAQQERVFK